MMKNMNEAQEIANEIDVKQYSLELFGTKVNAQKSADLIQTMLIEYEEKPSDMALIVWLQAQYEKYTKGADSKEIVDVVEVLTTIDKNYSELSENEKNGIPESKWFGKQIEKGATAANITNIASYASSVDSALADANFQSLKTYTNIDGSINLNQNLHGFVAEAHHVNTFNLEASSSGSQYHARMLEGNGKNSVDIVIDDMIEGRIVKRVQSKYGYDSEATASYLKDGDYRGQRKLVPDGQEKDIAGTINCIESPDGVKSKPLSYSDAQSIKAEIQIKKEIFEYKWDGLDKTTLTKSIVGETATMLAFHTLFQGARIFGSRLVKTISGKKQNKVEEDMKDFFNSSLHGAKTIVPQSIVTTAMLISARNGLIPALKHTPAGKIAEIVYVGMQNAKILYKIGQGKLSVSNGMLEMQKITLSAVGGLVAAGKGALVGSFMGPVGTVVGGIVGGVVGSIAGSTVGEAIKAGVNRVKKPLKAILTKSYETCKKVATSILRSLNPLNLLSAR